MKLEYPASISALCLLALLNACGGDKSTATPTPAVSLSGRVLSADGTGKTGVQVSVTVNGVPLVATTDVSGNWSITSATPSANIPDTLRYSFNGSTFLRDTLSNMTQSGIVRIYDSTWNAQLVFGKLTDDRDGQSYRTVKIGTQTWMAQNLNYQVDSSWCPQNIPGNCQTYGRLYQWAAAMGVPVSYNTTTWGGTLPRQGACPTGWHIPTDAEWKTLLNTVGASAGLKLQANSRLWMTKIGTDTFGFRILPAGYRQGSNLNSPGAFSNLGMNLSLIHI